MRVGRFDKLRQEGHKEHHHFRIGEIDADPRQKGCKDALLDGCRRIDGEARSVAHGLIGKKQKIDRPDHFDDHETCGGGCQQSR